LRAVALFICRDRDYSNSILQIVSGFLFADFQSASCTTESNSQYLKTKK